MITRNFLLERGFERDRYTPTTVEEYFMYVKPKGGYISVRFQPNKENAVGLYAYSESENTFVRKVVLSDTDVTIRDFEMAKEICRL